MEELIGDSWKERRVCMSHETTTWEGGRDLLALGV